jgi:hypothetical protein
MFILGKGRGRKEEEKVGEEEKEVKEKDELSVLVDLLEELVEFVGFVEK